VNPTAPAAPRTPGAVSLRPIAILAFAVLAAHLALLAGLPETFSPGEPAERVRPMLTRTLTAAPAAATAVSPPPTAALAAPKPRPSPRRRPAISPTTPAAPADLPALANGAEPPVAQATPQPAETGAEPASQPASAPAATAEPDTPPVAAAPAPASAESRNSPVLLPAPVHLSYSVQAQARGIPYTARAELHWAHDGSRYDARLAVSAFLVGSRTQTSSGRITPEGLAPSRFSDRSRSELAAHFDHERQRITFSANTPEAPLQAGAQDRLSLFLQVGALIAADPARYRPGTSLTLQTAGPRNAEPWLLTVEGDETLELADQSLPTVKLLRLPRHQYDTRLELWLGRSLSHLPVRIRITQANGDFVDQQLRAIEPPATR
jgi:hypothetical protein